MSSSKETITSDAKTFQANEKEPKKICSKSEGSNIASTNKLMSKYKNGNNGDKVTANMDGKTNKVEVEKEYQ
ncbi:hypothetical protein Tco_1410277 [Tanacetum coccineum]